MDAIISAKAFSKLNPEHYILIDAGSGEETYQRYLNQHLKGAIYLDLNQDLAEIPKDAKQGGRHPLPAIKDFLKTLQHSGIEKDSHVIIYDDKQASNAAARLWWMLKAVGVKTVQVLNGGLQMAIAAGIPTDSGIETPNPSPNIIEVETWQLPMVTLEDMKNHYQNSNYRIIDVRSAERYAGLSEPIDTVAGHIPNAVNVPFSNNLNEDGTFKTPEELKKIYADYTNNPSKHTIVHCGSGVTACHTLLAIDYAGLPLPSLYVGSWSEWSRNDLPIEK